MTGPRIGSLFSGYGGLDLAVESVTGATPAWFVEFDQAPSRVLAHHWPDVPNYGDITAVDWAAVEPVDILTGGFPCQDLSHAGKRLGLRPGTRSGLWEHMAYAIDQLRPRMVVIENVRGLLSASAHSDLERDCWCVGDDREPALRALGAVLGDLAELGYDARWGGVRAADAGAPHGRFRVFVVAQPADADLPGLEGRPTERQRADQRPARPGGLGAVALLPTPSAADGLGGHKSRGGDRGHERLLAGIAKDLALLPTPKASDGPNGGPGMRNGRGEADALPGVVSLLPTPMAGDAKAARNSTATRHRIPPTGIHAGDTLTDILVPTTGARRRGNSTEAGPDQALSDVRGADDPQELRPEADPRGHGSIPVAEDLRPGLWQHADGGDSGGAPLEGAATSRDDVPGVRDDGGAARSSHRPGPDAQRPGQPDDAVRVLPSAAALAGGSSAEDGGRAPGTGDVSGTWGPYAAAILRWEMVTGRVAPPPTETGKDGRPRLSARAVEWMMGLPLGHVTDPVIGLTRAQQLKALGNGVVPAQAALALRMLLGLGGAVAHATLPMLKTPTAQLAVNGGSQHPDKRKSGGHGPTLADEVEHLLPTPAVNDMGEGKTAEDWDAWTERMKAKHGNGNGHGKSLAIEAMRLGGGDELA